MSLISWRTFLQSAMYAPRIESSSVLQSSISFRNRAARASSVLPFWMVGIAVVLLVDRYNVHRSSSRRNAALFLRDGPNIVLPFPSAPYLIVAIQPIAREHLLKIRQCRRDDFF